MGLRRHTPLKAAATIIAVMLLFPPYAGIDRESGGELHGSIGYHPVWNPPTSLDVYRALEGISTPPSDVSVASYEVILNKVQLTFNIVVVLVVTAVVILVMRRKRE
jgi:hypothetical protein